VTHCGPKKTIPAKPLLLSSSQSSGLPKSAKNEKDLATTKKRLSIPNLTQPPQKEKSTITKEEQQPDTNPSSKTAFTI
jgi:hypothetical protein